MKLNEKSKQIIFEIVPIILFALALVIRFAVDIERLQWGLMEVAAITDMSLRATILASWWNG